MRAKEIFTDYLLPTRQYVNISREGYFVLHPVLGYLAKLKKTFFLNLNDFEFTDDINIALPFQTYKEARKKAMLWRDAKVVTKPMPSAPLECLP